MAALSADIRTALRMFTTATRFTLGAVLTLAIGIGPVTAVFSILHATLFEPMPYPEPDELVMVWSLKGRDYGRTPAADYLEFRERATSFEFLEVYRPRDVNVGLPEAPERMRTRQVSPDGHRVLGEGVVMGRDFAAHEDQPGADQVVLLSHRVWQQRFDGDPNIIGRRIRIDLAPHTVIGVMPPGPQDRRVADLWTPLTRTPEWRTRRGPMVNVVGRLKPGVTIERARQEMQAIAGDIARRQPADQRLGVAVEPFHNNFMSTSLARYLWLLLAAVAFVVAIACVNIAYLMLSRGMDRAREMAVRISLGATRWQLVRLTLIESMAVALCGGALGALWSVWILKATLALMPPYLLPTEAEPRLSVSVLLFTMAVTVCAALLFGSAAAWQASRLETNAVLKNASRDPAGRRVRQGIVLAEFSLAVILLCGAGLTLYSFWLRASVNPGVRTERVLTFSLTLPETQFSSTEQTRGFYDQLLARIRTLPGVASVSVTSNLPFTGEHTTNVVIEGRDDAAGPARDAEIEHVGAGYFETIGTPIVAGRGFGARDRDGSLPVAVVSERFAARYLGGRNAIGQRVSLPGADGAAAPRMHFEIVGVAGNVTGGQFGDWDMPKIYLPILQRAVEPGSVLVHGTSDPDTLRKAIAVEAAALVPDLPLARVRTMEQVVSGRLASDRLSASFFGAMALIALVLAGLGIHNAMACTVAQQTRDIGVRLALGADRRQIMRQVMGEGVTLAGAGLLLGLAGAYWLGRVMESTLYGVPPFSLPVWAAAAATLLLAAVVACYLPARRASAVDPLMLLRSE